MFFCRFMLCADYESYIKCQDKVSQTYTVSLNVLNHLIKVNESYLLDRHAKFCLCCFWKVHILSIAVMANNNPMAITAGLYGAREQNTKK